jgi:hypothetical protein
MCAAATTDDDTEIVPVPMDRETRKRLVAFARSVELCPVDAAATLLKDLLVDDEFWIEAGRPKGKPLN